MTMTESKKPPKFKFTEEQKQLLADVRKKVEQDKPELMAEGRRILQTDEVLSVRLKAVMSILKAVRKAKGITLEELASRTGMTKPYLSKIENEVGANVTVNTIYRIAEAMEHDLQISVIPMEATSPKRKLTRGLASS
jgi:DNA-binding Xre family transcriptional regulator